MRGITRIIGISFSLMLIVAYNDCGKYQFSSAPQNNGLNGVDGIPPNGGVPITPPTLFNSSNCTLTYPYSSSTPATDISFNEARILDAFTPSESVQVSGSNIAVWYSDE